jgi:hypothetical protein
MEQEGILDGEELRPIVGFEDYMVSNFGRIYSIKRTKSKGGFLKAQTNGNGYNHVIFNKGAKRITVRIHKLVAIAFLDNPDNLRTVNHKDGIKKNNFASNLEWCTQSDNLKHALINGLRVPPSGEKCWNARLSKADVIQIREMLSTGMKIMIISKEFGVSYGCINGIKLGRSWINVP